MRPAKTQISRCTAQSDQSLCCMCLLQPSGYPKRNNLEPLPYRLNAQADLCLCWSHRSYCRFCHAVTGHSQGRLGSTSAQSTLSYWWNFGSWCIQNTHQWRLIRLCRLTAGWSESLLEGRWGVGWGCGDMSRGTCKHVVAHMCSINKQHPAWNMLNSH